MTFGHRFTGEEVICPRHLSTPCSKRKAGRPG
jgi:hypothetical protein